MTEPALEIGEIVIVLGDVEGTAFLPPYIGFYFLFEAFPYP